jgi:flagellar biosynthetic protein FlhB
MADEDQDESQKTEDPTHRRLDEAIKKGQVAFSREVTSFMMLLVFALLVIWIAPHLMEKTTLYLAQYIAFSDQIPINPEGLMSLTGGIIRDFFLLMIVPLVAAVVAALSGAWMQNGFIASMEPIMPKLDKISPLKGLSRLFSVKSIIELLKGLFKISVIAGIATLAITPELTKIGELHTYSMAGILSVLAHLASKILIGVLIFMFIIAGVDYLYQRFEYMKSLRMSKRDLKEEFKQSEGNPEVKAKLRQLRAERAQQRMMAAVPKADVVITNPTHVAIALEYNSDLMKAPKCVAKGQEFMALRIREIAREHKVPIVENPPLARALFESVEVDEEVPVRHYKAVAEVIGYVYRLKGKMPKKRA